MGITDKAKAVQEFVLDAWFKHRYGSLHPIWDDTVTCHSAEAASPTLEQFFTGYIVNIIPVSHIVPSYHCHNWMTPCHHV